MKSAPPFHLLHLTPSYAYVAFPATSKGIDPNAFALAEETLERPIIPTIIDSHDFLLLTAQISDTKLC